jgi:chemotaxis signal transduction protein
MAEAMAWIMNLDGGLRTAVGEREMMHLVETPVFADIPQTPLHCQQVLIWEGELLPVVDLAAWMTGQPSGRTQACVGIVGWQDQPGASPQYGALLFTGIPAKVRVKDEQVCDLPERPSGWEIVAISCFSHNGQPIPILDVPLIFSEALVTRH